MSLGQVWTTATNTLVFRQLRRRQRMRSNLDFYRIGCGKEPPPRSKYLPMGHIGRHQTRLRHLHRAHRRGGISFPIIYVMLPNEKEATFVRAFGVIKRFTNSFTETSVAHVDCQPATIIALSKCSSVSRGCLFHKSRAVLQAVSRLGLAGAYNSREYPKLHVWVRRLLALPFLTEDVALSTTTCCLNRTQSTGKYTWRGAASKRLNNSFNITNRFGC